MNNILDLSTLFIMGSVSGSFFIQGIDNKNYFLLSFVWAAAAFFYGAGIRNRMNNE